MYYFSRSFLFIAISSLVFRAICACDESQTIPAQSIATQLTHNNNDAPSLAPDGRRMVAITNVEGVEQLSILSMDGSELKRLTADNFSHEDPAWSPDGKHIVYISFKDGDEVVHVMDADGKHDRAISPRTQKAIHPVWSPDGKAVFYCTDDDLHPPAKNTSEIYRIDLQKKGALKLIVEGGVNTYPKPSPDGRHLAFRRMVEETNSEIFVADIDGRNAHNITNSPAFDGWPEWSPDSREIAFASNPAGNHKIYVMNTDGSNVRLVANTPGRGTAPQWSRDGKKIFFTICQRINGNSNCEIYVAPAPR
jgi:TolB protein